MTTTQRKKTTTAMNIWMTTTVYYLIDYRMMSANMRNSSLTFSSQLDDILGDEREDSNDLDESFVSKLDGGAAGVKYIETDEVISSLCSYILLCIYLIGATCWISFCHRISMGS